MARRLYRAAGTGYDPAYHGDSGIEYTKSRLYQPGQQYRLGAVGSGFPVHMPRVPTAQAPQFGAGPGLSRTSTTTGGERDAGGGMGMLGSPVAMAVGGPIAWQGMKGGYNKLFGTPGSATGTTNPYGLELGVDTAPATTFPTSEVPHTILGSQGRVGLDLGAETALNSGLAAEEAGVGAATTGAAEAGTSSFAGLGGPAAIAAVAAMHDVPMMLNDPSIQTAGKTQLGQAIPGVTSIGDFAEGHIGKGFIDLIPGMSFITNMFPDFFDW